MFAPRITIENIIVFISSFRIEYIWSDLVEIITDFKMNIEKKEKLDGSKIFFFIPLRNSYIIFKFSKFNYIERRKKRNEEKDKKR